MSSYLEFDEALSFLEVDEVFFFVGGIVLIGGRFSSFLEADEIFLLSGGNEVMFYLKVCEVLLYLEVDEVLFYLEADEVFILPGP